MLTRKNLFLKKLDIEKEHDLVGVTQYYINSNLENRGAINQEIVRKFSSADAHIKVMNSLLPIFGYWTTNYDKVIETDLKINNRRGGIKRRGEDLSI